jgi:site-specific DNA-methyltransferase (adenine-specific)
MIKHQLQSGVIWEGDWTEAPLEPGYDMAEVDGPYAMGLADWDMMGVAGLAAWYRPHLERLTSLMAKSASIYLWNTAEGWALLNPEIQRLGWTFRSLIVWNKGLAALAGKGMDGVRTWPSVTEFCGFYQREEWALSTCAGSEIAYAAGRDERNWVRPWLLAEWTRAGLKMKDADWALGTSGMAGHYFQPSQWALPTWEAYQKLAAYAENAGTPGIFIKDGFPDLQSTYDHLRAEYDHLRAEYDHLRAEYEASRPFFALPKFASNNWDCGKVADSERLRDSKGDALHPCQKPLLFAERMVQASTRPGARILIPFGGTCRIATYLERLKRMEPESARYYDCCELNADGKDYLGAVLGRMGEDAAAKSGQIPLFGARK